MRGKLYYSGVKGGDIMECVKGNDFRIVTLGDLMSDVDLSKRDIDSIKAACSGGKDIIVMSRPKWGNFYFKCDCE